MNFDDDDYRDEPRPCDCGECIACEERLEAEDREPAPQRPAPPTRLRPRSFACPFCRGDLSMPCSVCVPVSQTAETTDDVCLVCGNEPAGCFCRVELNRQRERALAAVSPACHC